MSKLGNSASVFSRHATKLIGSLRDKVYPERLATLKLPSLEHRRKSGDMIDTNKYVHGIYKTDKPQFTLSSNKASRGHSLKQSKVRCRLNVRSAFFAERVINTWNGLPEEVVTAPTLAAFKGRLDTRWASIPSLYECYH
ncbi:uncharacterized protein LOC143281482 [Babylonia areolata]|uniref:uncharacterized protein LOC143281482 n=1 Tax=Babylonia areolata TaxID=304850 RepID=UPI003FD11E67